MRNTNLSTDIIKPLLSGLILLNLAIVLFASFELYKSKQQAEKQAAITTQNLSQVLENSITGLVDKIDLVLLATADEIQNQIATGHVDKHKLTEFLKLQNQRVPDIFNLRITDEKGNLRYGSDFSALPSVNYADRDYFRQQRDSAETGIFIDKPVFGKTTKKWLLTLSRRFNKSDGSFGGVVFASISLEHIKELFTVVDVGFQGVITLRDNEFAIIATSGGMQLSGSLVGLKKQSIPFEVALKNNPNKGTYISDDTSIDHISRTHSYRKFETYPFYINSGITEAEYLAGWRKQAWETGVLIFILMLSSTAFSFLLVRLLRKQKSYENELYLQKEYLQAIFENELECVKVLTPNGALVDINPAGLKILEVESLEEAQQLGCSAFINPDYHQAFTDLLADVYAGNPRTLEFKIKGKKGTIRWMETHSTPLRNSLGHVTNLLAVTRDITEHKLFQQELERQAHIDYLTGVNSRGYFMEQAELELARAIRYGSKLSMFMMDIDFFKQVNDRYGHKVGDNVLKKLAKICREVLREVDILGRVGGEEFAILLPATDKVAASEVAERLRATIADTRVTMESGLPIQFTVSIGISSLTSKDDNLDVLASQADKALYEAKKKGRNQVCVSE
ncbi:MAG: diguanylate cyclase [Pseudomonadota bacterium]